MKKFSILLLCFLLLASHRAGCQDIFEAARKGNVKRIDSLFKIKPDTINAINEAGFTPLIIAVYRGQEPAARLLLKHNVKVNTDSPEGTALMSACFKGNAVLAKVLIENGADVNLKSQQGTTALIFAVLSGNKTLVSLLVDNGAQKQIKDNYGRTAMDHARTVNDRDLEKILE